MTLEREGGREIIGQHLLGKGMGTELRQENGNSEYSRVLPSTSTHHIDISTRKYQSPLLREEQDETVETC